MLEKETNPHRGLSMADIIERLAQKGLDAERKGIYRDLEALRSFGLDIQKLKRRPTEYALCTRVFELSHITLLIDAVQSSRFLSDDTANVLVASLKGLASIPERKTLDKQVHVHGRPKKQEWSDFAAVDKIQEAMRTKHKLLFCYFTYDASKKPVAHNGGKPYEVTPIHLVYSDNNYYLVAYNAENEEIRNYRVDRMGDIHVSEKPRDKGEEIATYDMEEAAQTAFGMYAGKRVIAHIKVDANLMKVVIDRFSRDVESKVSDSGKPPLFA